ncbi:MAG: hypothetical protein HW421_2865 [Ignavibacteria bacterium]|nr:hypothetical protein [Ignavibacteria bacterium]
MENEVLLAQIAKEIYPFTPKVIVQDNNIYLLNAKLFCKVEFLEDDYIIRNEEFDLTVWGDSRDEAEEAFAFAFDALYKNFVFEKDENLTEQARVLKNKLNHLVYKIARANEN